MNNEEKKQLVGIKFLDDSPIFEDKVDLHSRIAQTIKNIIELIFINEKDFYKKKIIGLFGSWGSGKSTIVEILKQDLGEERVFVFDSWSYRGDFLKRAFLLELANNLGVKQEEYIKNNDEGKVTIETILTRKIMSKTVDSKPLTGLNKSIKILTGLILFSIIVVAFSKISEYLIIPWIPAELISKLDLLREHQWLIGAIIFFGISIIAVWKWKTLDNILTNFINFYFLKKVDITESHTTKEDLEFTNYDYGKYFFYIMNKAKERGKLNMDRPFVIVFDNLDRVEDEAVLNTLSLIQLTSEAINKLEFNNIYFIIPIDKERLEKTIKTIIAESDTDDTEKERFARDFLEKIFPYKVTIPNIRHTNWRKFFAELIEEAFDSLSENDVLFIRRLFEQTIVESKTILTPREIKNFINSLVGNYIFWQNSETSVDIKLQALFVALNTYLNDGLQDFIKTIDGNLEKREERTKHSSEKIEKVIDIAKREGFSEVEIKESLLKQFYKTDKIHTLYVEPINNAINNKDIETIDRIIERLGDKHKSAALIESTLESKSDYEQDINLLLKLAYCFNESKLRDIYDVYEGYLISSLKNLINDIESLSKLDISQVEVLRHIIGSNTEIRDIFIEKSIEIILTIPSEEEGEA